METHVVNNPAESVEHRIPSLLVPMMDKYLLLPTVSVAEMLPYVKPKYLLDATRALPQWYLGEVLWRGIMIPMVSYEAMNGHAIAPVKGVSQMVVLNSTGVHPQLPFICFPTQGIPRLSRVGSDNVAEELSVACQEFDTMSVAISGEFAAIPDVAKIEQAYVNCMNL